MEIADPDKIVDYLEGAYAARLRLTRERDRTSPLTNARVDVGAFAIDNVTLPGEVRSAPDPLNKVMVVWPSRGFVAASCAGTEAMASPGEIVLVSQPDLPHRAHMRDVSAVSVMIDPGLLFGAAGGWPENGSPKTIRFESMRPVNPAAGLLWRDTVRYIQRCVLADDSIATPLVLGHASRLLVAATLAAFPNTMVNSATAIDRSDGHPALLRRAKEFMEENAANDIALADIATALGVTPRAVQYAFRRHLDITPLQYLRCLRLDRAHAELLEADSREHSVAEIAARWGFAHTGRFAMMYRKAYGVSPRGTLLG